MIVVFGSINADLIFTLEELPAPGQTLLSHGMRIEQAARVRTRPWRQRGTARRCRWPAPSGGMGSLLQRWPVYARRAWISPP